MDIKKLFDWLSAALFLLAFVPYITAIVAGHTKPRKSSWMIWGSVDVLVLVAMLRTTGTANGLIIGAVIGAWSIVALSFKYGEPGWTWLDKTCIVAAVGGIFLWWYLGSLVGMLISLGVIFVGAFPTFGHAWSHPEQESKLAWMLYWLSCVAATLAVPVWDVAHAAQPLTFLTIETVMVFLVWVPVAWRMRILLYSGIACQLIVWGWFSWEAGKLDDYEFIIFTLGMLLGQFCGAVETWQKKSWGTFVVQAYFFVFTAYAGFQRLS